MSRIIAIVVLTLLLGAVAADAQHHAQGADGAPHREMQTRLDEIDQVIAQGRGAGLAFAADQNGYPGPMHVLELKDVLRLTPAQEARMTALRTAMFAEWECPAISYLSS